MTNTKVPSTWSTSVIVPIFKKGDRSNPRCYRPISLIDNTLKILGRVFFNKIRSLAEEERVLNRCQLSFRSNLRTVEQCLNLNLIIGKYTIARHSPIYLAFMDLTSAFDFVNRSRLWSCLSNYGLDEVLVHFLAYLHRDLRVRISMNGAVSGDIVIGRGVRQGCVLARCCLFYILMSYIMCCLN